MDELNDLISFDWFGTKRERYTKDRWSDDKNCRKLKDSKSTAQALLTGPRQLNKTGQYKLVAVDLDNRYNWDEVLETYKALALPKSLTVATPTGGYHIFFWVQKDIPMQSINDDRHCKNFELKGDMSNITAPGSVFACGASYLIVRDAPIARLHPGEAYRLAPFKQVPRFDRDWGRLEPDPIDVDSLAKQIDNRARRNPRGWGIRCPMHDDKRSSAVLFDSGWLYCSGCGAKERLIRRE